MKRVTAWMLATGMLAALTAGCTEKAEEPVAKAPPEETALPPYPAEQIPDPEEQPPVETAALPADAPPVDTTATAPKTSPDATARPLPKESYPPEPAKAPRTYIVKQGDTLQRISNQFYGTSRKWRTIYEANRGTLKKGPDVLQIGMKLEIP